MALQLLKDGKTFADINSEEPKICFLHGWGGSSSDFSLITNNFESIAIDLPGFGKSKEPESSMNPKEYAEYIINLIPDTVEVLVGHSFGGKVAVHMSFMKNYKNLVLIGSPLIRKTPEVTLNLRLNLYKFLNSLNLISDKRLEKYKNKYGSEDYKNANKHLKDTLVMAVNDDLKGILPYIDTKVELVWGEEDLEVPLQVGLDSNDIIPNSELTIIPGGGHNVLMSSSEIIIEVIKK